MEEDIARVRRDIGGPSLTGMTYDELTSKSEERRKAPVHLRQPGRSRGLVKKVLAVGAIVAASMYAGAKYEKQISAVENTVTNYVTGLADNQTYAAEATSRE